MKRYLFLLISLMLLSCSREGNITTYNEPADGKFQIRYQLSDIWLKDSLLIKEFMSKHEIPPIHQIYHDKEKIKSRINKLRELSSHEEVRSNPILNFFVNVTIASDLLRLADFGDSSGISEAENRFVQSLKIIPPEFKRDIFWVNMFLAHIYGYTGRFEQSFNVLSNLIESDNEPQLKIQAVRSLYGIALTISNGDIHKPEVSKVVNYLSSLMSRYKDEIGVMAGISICDYYIQDKRTEIAEEILKDLKSSPYCNKYPEIDNYIKFCEAKLARVR